MKQLAAAVISVIKEVQKEYRKRIFQSRHWSTKCIMMVLKIKMLKRFLMMF